MADMNFDKGTTKLINHPDAGPVLVESQGFVVVAHCATQDEARAIKKAVRALGIVGVEVDYEVKAAVA